MSFSFVVSFGKLWQEILSIFVIDNYVNNSHISKKKTQFGSDWDQGLTVHNSGSKTQSKVIVGGVVATHWASDG